MTTKINFYKKHTAKKIAYVIYDCSIDDLDERNASAMHFQSGTQAANYLGVDHRRLSEFTSKTAIAAKKRFCSDKHGGKEFAIRIAK